MMLNTLFTALRGTFMNTETFGQKLNIKRPYAMGLYCEIKEKVLLQSDISLEKYPDFINISWSATASLMRRHAQESPLPQGSVKIPMKLWIGKEKASLEIFRKIKGFVFDNYLEPEKMLQKVKAEEEEEDEFFTTFFIFRLISLQNNQIRIFKCNIVFLFKHPLDE